jgi:hypothetical protein
VAPLVGLYAAFFLALISAAPGGRPGMISGATGALAVVMVSLVIQHGVEYLFATVVLMGLLQILFGMARLGKFIRMVPHSVMLGFVNGLAIVIFLSQFSHFKTTGPDGVQQWMSGVPLYTMLGLIALTMSIIYLLPKLTRAIPATLGGILVVSILVATLGIDTKTVGDLGSIKGGLPDFHWPQVPLNLETLGIIFPYALILAAIGLIETLLTLNLIDEMSNTRGKPNRESLAQGLANVVAGLFGSMGGCAMIGQFTVWASCLERSSIIRRAVNVDIGSSVSADESSSSSDISFTSARVTCVSRQGGRRDQFACATRNAADAERIAFRVKRSASIEYPYALLIGGEQNAFATGSGIRFCRAIVQIADLAIVGRFSVNEQWPRSVLNSWRRIRPCCHLRPILAP